MAERRTSGCAAAAFWIVAVVLLPGMVIAWFWFGLDAGQRPVGRCDLLQVWLALATSWQLLLAHLGGVLVLLACALRAWPSRGRALATTAFTVAAVSTLGMLVAQWFWRGELFAVAAGVCWV